MTKTPQEGTFYDHPYFAQLFLGGTLWITGYPNILHPTPEGDVVNLVKNLWLGPRLLIGVLGVIDTFLVYKIAERRYNTLIALIGSVFFAIFSITFLRTLFLESIQMPLVLASILLAVSAKFPLFGHVKINNLSMTLLSGIFLGLAIFTKIPAFAMIPFVGFLIYENNRDNVRRVSIWLIPVILIPLIWPAHALLNDQLGDWWDGIYWQMHRLEPAENLIESNKQDTLSNAIIKNFLTMPILMSTGFAGIILAAIRKDYFLLLWTLPLLIFLYFLGFVRDFHLIPLLPPLCIASSNLIVYLAEKVRHNKLRKILPFSVLSLITIIVLANIITPLFMNNNDSAFAKAALVLRYLQDNKSENITMISSHVYSWIPKYLFQNGHEYWIPEVDISALPQNEKVLMVADGPFKGILFGNDSVGRHLGDIYAEHSKNGTTTIESGSDKIVLPLQFPSGLLENQTNILDSELLWKSDKKVNVSQRNDNLDIFIKNNATDESTYRVSLKTQINNQRQTPLLLFLEYSAYSPRIDTRFPIEIRDTDFKTKTYFKGLISDTSGNLTRQIFLVSSDIIGKNIELRLGITTKIPGEYFLSVKKAAIIYSLSN
jgi:hypothetical protein